MVEQSEVPEVGTRVRLVATTWNGPTEVEGVLLAATAAEHITVKLVNGYNATHTLEMVESIIDIGTSKSVNLEYPEVSMNADLPLIHILHTGGTIASKVDYTTGAVTARFEPEEILAAIPELGNVAQIKTKKLGNMWSDDIRPQHWNRMIEAVATSFSEGAVGVVITHGTDTMHLSAAAIAFAFSGTGGRPAGRIALTGSQRSSDRGSTDGAENLIAAVHWAAFGPEPSGVTDSTVVVMHGSGDDGIISVNPGCAVRKNHSSKRDAFVSINQNPLASISIDRDGVNMTLTDSYSNVLNNNPRIVNLEPTNFDCDVKIMQLLSGPHLQADQISHAMENDYQGVLFWGTGLGHLPLDNPGDAPENDEVQDAISNYIAGGGIVVITTQCISGPVHLDVYSKGRVQQELGILGHGTNFTPEVSIVKLHYLLSLGLKENEISSAWAENLVGENPSSI